ncbi:phosphate/phosphite/phosphonate ABC transporters, periplasmic binding protein [Thalassovita gelatinovora]|uniref:Phosphate/phosphite/phosphonate ABC transporters, periplasmic binding protein n=1 Tax=Thalassovita gelatinovora TaxID=53501 RepID=A0A0P1FGE2_THAGE|nr:PhnD/SsuA/transferrin family substrate-binding protein [Thalassovita gelatinovora]QIZ81826.1 PhnD/SsuA/transferrin family substrate-binding protein [Thalassovita gelatinovora]CUH67113.1 phosphate/phosphite/phosphonate ABC transporters, periplasmic binding protein [Thalassovita gelatinovora]SEP80281.1 phosphonate transport system substrate-binding protein [Thalassovita gelatinovora]
MIEFTRRKLLGSSTAALFLEAISSKAEDAFRLGLTPVFLDNDAEVIDQLRTALAAALGVPIELEQRRTYEEVTGLLLEGSVDAAWLCGYPYLQHRDALSLVAVPVWNGKSLYQSYLIAGKDDTAMTLEDLRGGTHAFSDPDSNSGYLVTASDLARLGLRPEGFFRRTIFTYGHRNVVRAVSDGLVRSGSVDGYVWEALAKAEPGLTAGTRVIARSEWLGFPPFCARSDRMKDNRLLALGDALLGLDQTDEGRVALGVLQLDGMTTGGPELYDGIESRIRDYENLR